MWYYCIVHVHSICNEKLNRYKHLGHKGNEKSIKCFWGTKSQRVVSVVYNLWRALAVHQAMREDIFRHFYVLIFWYFIQNSGVVHILLYITIVFLLKSTLFLLFSVIYGWVFSPCFFLFGLFFSIHKKSWGNSLLPHNISLKVNSFTLWQGLLDFFFFLHTTL